jgi:hypothetical protein
LRPGQPWWASGAGPGPPESSRRRICRVSFTLEDRPGGRRRGITRESGPGRGRRRYGFDHSPRLAWHRPRPCV